METGYVIYVCCFPLVKVVSTHMCYKTGGMLGLIGLSLCHRPQASSLGGSSIGFSQTLQTAACLESMFSLACTEFFKM